jgi:hypothetical protein
MAIYALAKGTDLIYRVREFPSRAHEQRLCVQALTTGDNWDLSLRHSSARFEKELRVDSRTKSELYMMGMVSHL